jgi:hypothetical protein
MSISSCEQERGTYEAFWAIATEHHCATSILCDMRLNPVLMRKRFQDVGFKAHNFNKKAAVDLRLKVTFSSFHLKPSRVWRPVGLRLSMWYFVHPKFLFGDVTKWFHISPSTATIGVSSGSMFCRSLEKVKVKVKE